MSTIFALSSGRPPAAIAIIRISGPAAAAALKQLTGTLPTPRKATLASVRDPVSGELLDNALILWFAGPASATGEDLAELHLHGGRAVVEGVLEVLQALPRLRHADPGEFTRRALGNGRIDLNEAEGLADLLAAETRSQRRAALLAAGGIVTRRVEEWRTQLIEIAASIEAAIDFSEEDDVSSDRLIRKARADTTSLAAQMAELLAHPPAERLRDGVRVVVAGPPNSGKSSLVNALCDRDVAITSPTAGTTRDVIEVPVAWNGVPILLIDTAGLRDTSDDLEAAGIARANQQILAGDIVVWLDEAPFAAAAPHLPIYPRCDDRPMQHERLAVSAMTRHNIDVLKSAITAMASGLLPAEGELALKFHQRDVVTELVGLLADRAERFDPLLFADDVRAAIARCDRLNGRSGTEDMLDALFGRFCIGK